METIKVNAWTKGNCSDCVWYFRSNCTLGKTEAKKPNDSCNSFTPKV